MIKKLDYRLIERLIKWSRRFLLGDIQIGQLIESFTATSTALESNSLPGLKETLHNISNDLELTSLVGSSEELENKVKNAIQELNGFIGHE